tara:strand:- start:62 stop:451 length:390 start_codon:yes stop_codon:yes gene_type:complete
MNRKEKTINQLKVECKKRKIGFMTSWTKLALINRLEDEDKREISLNELKEEVKEKDLKLEALDPETVQKNVLGVLAAGKRNDLARAEKRWRMLTKEQDEHYAEVERIGELKKALRNEINNLELFLKSLE